MPRLISQIAGNSFTPCTALCKVCEDQGYTVARFPRVVHLDDAPVSGEFILVELGNKVVCECRKGLEQIFRWQAQTGCRECCFGTVLRPGVKTFCTYCEEGRRLQAFLDAQVAAHRQAQLNKLVAEAGMPPLLRGQTFESFQTAPGGKVSREEAGELEVARQKVWNAAREFRSLFLSGESGIGKSHLSAAYLNYAFEHGRTGLLVSVIDLLDSLYSTLDSAASSSGSGDAGNWSTVLKRFIEADVLILDDLGQEKVSEKTNEVIFQLLNKRINLGKPTVVSSNHLLTELKKPVREGGKGYSTGVVSRLSGFEQVFWDVKDWRSKN